MVVLRVSESSIERMVHEFDESYDPRSGRIEPTYRLSTGLNTYPCKKSAEGWRLNKASPTCLVIYRPCGWVGGLEGRLRGNSPGLWHDGP
jgi:hypothetical protein